MMVQTRNLKAGDQTRTTDGRIATILSVQRASWVRAGNSIAWDVRWQIGDETGYAIVSGDDQIEVMR